MHEARASKESCFVASQASVVPIFLKEERKKRKEKTEDSAP